MIDLSYKAKIRLYFPGKLSLEDPVKLENKQVHYLINVMRKKIDDTILVFNSVNGEYLAKISEIYYYYDGQLSTILRMFENIYQLRIISRYELSMSGRGLDGWTASSKE